MSKTKYADIVIRMENMESNVCVSYDVEKEYTSHLFGEEEQDRIIEIEVDEILCFSIWITEDYLYELGFDEDSELHTCLIQRIEEEIRSDTQDVEYQIINGSF